MVKVRSKRVTLSELFTNKRGNSRYTKAYVNRNTGDFEVYTGSTKTSFGFIDTYEYETPHLTYTTDGEYAGTLDVLQGKYNVGGHRAILISKVDNLSLSYCKYVFQSIFYNSVRRGDVPSLAWSQIKDIRVSIPVNEDGEFDLKKQEEIVRKFEIIEARKAELSEKIQTIKSVEVDIISGDNDKTTSIKVAELFDLTISTNSSKFTKTFVKENSGDIPVYGASSDNLPSYGYVKDNAVIVDKDGKREFPVRYFENCLTYNIDGLAGYIFYHEGRFSLSEKVRPLVIKEEYASKVNPLYLKQVLEPIFRSHVKGRKGENGKNEYTKLNTSMIKNLEVVLPLTSSGEIDLEKQNQIVKNSQTILEMKNNIEKQGYQFIQSNLDFNSNGVPYIYIYNLS